MSRELTIVQLQPKKSSVYGDNGNLLALQQRLQWRGIAVNTIIYHSGDNLDRIKPDIILAGGGQDSNQAKLAQNLSNFVPIIKTWIEDGVPSLMVGGAYQIMGQNYVTANGETKPGLGIIDFTTKPYKEPFVGNLVVESQKFGQTVGYENHTGQTFLRASIKALGMVKKGFGNNGKDGQEGAMYKNFIGTYCHGPVLPKNPRLADFLILTALKRKYPNDYEISSLDDTTELNAQQQSANRPR